MTAALRYFSSPDRAWLAPQRLQIEAMQHAQVLQQFVAMCKDGLHTGRHLASMCAATILLNGERIMSATAENIPSEIGLREDRLVAQTRVFRVRKYTHVLDDREPS